MARKKDEAAEGGETMTMEQAAAADAERQEDEAQQQMEAEDDLRFKRHLLRIGGKDMVGDLTKAMLEIVEQAMKRAGQKKGWKGLPQADQKEIISRTEWAAKALTASAVSSVAGNTFPALPSFLKGVSIGDKGYKLVLETIVSDDRHRLALLGSITKRTLLVLADPDVYAQHDPIKPMKDQPELPGVPEPAATEAATDGEAGPSPLDETSGDPPAGQVH